MTTRLPRMRTLSTVQRCSGHSGQATKFPRPRTCQPAPNQQGSFPPGPHGRAVRPRASHGSACEVAWHAQRPWHAREGCAASLGTRPAPAGTKPYPLAPERQFRHLVGTLSRTLPIPHEGGYRCPPPHSWRAPSKTHGRKGGLRGNARGWRALARVGSAGRG